MTDFDDFIAEQTALGKLSKSAIVTAPSGEQILFYIDPTGYDGSTSGVHYLYRVIILDGEVKTVGFGPGVSDDSLLNVILTPDGPAVQYEFYKGGIRELTILPFDDDGYPNYARQNLDSYTTPSETAGVAVFGDGGKNELVGSALDDILRGEGGRDTLDGGNGDDLMYGGLGGDRMYGGSGDDNMFGNSGRDIMFGDGGNDTLNGGDGQDKLYGGFGNDLLIGGNNQDRLQGGSGEDELRGGDGADTLYGGDGADVLRGNKGSDYLQGGKSNDILRGDSGKDELRGNAGKDSLFGGNGDDTLHGGQDADVLRGGSGDDIMTGGSGADTFIFVAGDDSDTITDYQHGSDFIDLSAFGLTLEEASLTQDGTSVVVEAGDIDITLLNTDLTSLTGTDELI